VVSHLLPCVHGPDPRLREIQDSLSTPQRCPRVSHALSPGYPAAGAGRGRAVLRQGAEKRKALGHCHLAIRSVVRGAERSHLLHTTEATMTDTASPNPSQHSPVQLSNQLAALVAAAAQSVVAVHGGGRRPSSGIIWQPGLVVTAEET